MKFKISQQELLQALKTVGMVQRHYAVPSSENVVITATDKILFWAADSEIDIETEGQGEISEEGEFAISIQELTSWAQLVTGDITFTQKSAGEVLISSGGVRCKKKTKDVQRVLTPEIKTVEEFQFKTTAINRILFSSEKKGKFASVISQNGKVWTAVGNGYRFSVLNLGVGVDSIIPKRMYSIASSLENSEVTVRMDDMRVVFSIGNTKMNTKLIAEKAPNLSNGLSRCSEKLKASIKVKKSELLRSVKRIKLLYDSNPTVKKNVFLKTENNNLAVSSLQTEGGEEAENIPIEIDGNDVSACFHCHYLLEAIMFASGNTVEIKMGDEVLLIEDDNCKHVLSGIRFK